MQTFPNDEKNFRIFHGIRSHEGNAVRSSFRSGEGAESEGRRPEQMFKFRLSEMPFPGL